LNATYGIRSWLLTTDHKRIALLYLGSVTVSFHRRNLRHLIRIHLLTPTGAWSRPKPTTAFHHARRGHDLLFPDPSIPAVLGNS